ncbi:response regulator [Mycobacterium szulgai]|uniref:response regulator n=1 Tax=Mycobacterium szulgai TaxID=1787 RepID=UPI000A1DFB31|nr:response regulator [Mycobacterium szulgai]MCV7077783.1 response regulator [Mycobacterium szulgai]
MGGANLTVLVVDDDFRVANMHAGIVNMLPDFIVAATANSLRAAREVPAVDLALVDAYLPDGSGIDFVRELRGDSMVLTAATEAVTVRSSMAAGALGYLVKPFPPTELAARLAGYARYRKILAGFDLCPSDVEAALEALRRKVPDPQPFATGASASKQLVLQVLRASTVPMSAVEISATVGVPTATAHRYLAALITTGDVTIGMRNSATGRPEQEFAVTNHLPFATRDELPECGPIDNDL